MQCDCHECDSKRHKAIIDSTDKEVKMHDQKEEQMFYGLEPVCGGTIDLTPAMTPEEIEAARKAEEQEKEYRRKFARSGGLATSDAKTKACRENGKKGGWPKGKPRGKRTAGGEAHAGAMWATKKIAESELKGAQNAKI